MISLVCTCCGKTYERKQKGSKYCSQECYHIAHNSCRDVDIDWLRREYIDNGRSLGNIAKELGISAGSLHYKLINSGVECRTSKLGSAKYTFETVDKEWLLSEYLERNRPCSLIAADLGVNYTSVRRWLINMGVRIRPETSYRVGMPRSDEVKKKISAVVLSMKIRGAKCGMWKGGISFGEYCPKFNDRLKEEIREAFGRKCFLCGAPENGYKLHVHHCDYNKGQGCGQRWNLIPLCRSCHMKTNSNRHYYFNLLANHWVLNPEIRI